MSKIKGVRFNTDTNSIEYDNDDGTTTPVDNQNKPSFLQSMAKKMPTVTPNMVNAAKTMGKLPLALLPTGCGSDVGRYNPNLNFDSDEIEYGSDGSINVWGADIPMRVNNDLISPLGGGVLGRATVRPDGRREIEINKQLIEESERDIRKTILHELIHGYFRHGHDATVVDPDTKCNTNVMATFNTDDESRAECWGFHGDQMKEQYDGFNEKYGGYVDRDRFNRLKRKFPNDGDWFTGTRGEPEGMNLTEIETDDPHTRQWVRPKRLYE